MEEVIFRKEGKVECIWYYTELPDSKPELSELSSNLSNSKATDSYLKLDPFSLGRLVEEQWSSIGHSALLAHSFIASISFDRSSLILSFYDQNADKGSGREIFIFKPFSRPPKKIPEGGDGIIVSSLPFEFNSELSLWFVADELEVK